MVRSKGISKELGDIMAVFGLRYMNGHNISGETISVIAKPLET